ncbi:gliding motility lipoprotein GldB [Aurantibacter sp.]|uniref:gliding motility lipoprotein GldB n=1 Tax=Aurantibacter sp. TaxID=2807103 RepID=UPI0035C79ACE
MKKLSVLVLCIIVLVSCIDDSKSNIDVSSIEVNFNIERFDKAFGEAKPQDLPKLKAAFPFMFSNRFTDDFWLVQMQDSLQQELHKETANVFSNLSKQKVEITKLFKHLKYYNSYFKTPRVVTATSSVDYRNKVIVTDTIVLISLDTYLGDKHFFYDGLQEYLKANMKPEQMVVDIATKYGEMTVFQPKRKTLLDEMIYYGKLLAYKDRVIPFKSDAEKIGYSLAQFDWAKVNEENIWTYFIERELLFSTDNKLASQFINPAPFSKFYLAEIDSDSPGRIGRFVGWRIVKSYLKNNDVSFEDMLKTDAETIFNLSKYKPEPNE